MPRKSKETHDQSDNGITLGPLKTPPEIPTPETPKTEDTMFEETASALENMAPRQMTNKTAIVKRLYREIIRAKERGHTIKEIAAILTEKTNVYFSVANLRYTLIGIVKKQKELSEKDA